MRYISRCCLQLGEQSEALQWLYRAVAEAPHLREPYLELARLLYDRGDWDGVVFFCREALRITVRPRTYICESDSWGSLPWDDFRKQYHWNLIQPYIPLWPGLLILKFFMVL